MRKETAFGETVVMVGSTVQLGSWEPTKGVRLAWVDGLWRGQAHLPAEEVVEYKYAIVTEGGGAPQWEAGLNRALLPLCDPDVSDVWREEDAVNHHHHIHYDAPRLPSRTPANSVAVEPQAEASVGAGQATTVAVVEVHAAGLVPPRTPLNSVVSPGDSEPSGATAAAPAPEAAPAPAPAPGPAPAPAPAPEAPVTAAPAPVPASEAEPAQGAPAAPETAPAPEPAQANAEAAAPVADPVTPGGPDDVATPGEAPVAIVIAPAAPGTPAAPAAPAASTAPTAAKPVAAVGASVPGSGTTPVKPAVVTPAPTAENSCCSIL